MRQFLSDLAYAVRALQRAPALTTTAVLSLGIGIAATTAVFSFVNALQFKSLPFADPATLVDIEETSATELCAGCSVGTSYPTLLEWQARAQSFSAIAGFQETRAVISGSGEPERVPAGLTSAALFPLIGAGPALGRGITADDDRPGAAPVAVLSDALWRRRFGGQREAIGQVLKVDGVAHTIVGVMPAGFKFPEFAELWTPLAPSAHRQPRTDRSIAAIARLRPGLDAATAAAEMRTFTSGAWSVRVRSLHASMTEETTAPAAVLLGAVTFVLLIACANVSNLLLVRAAERSREISIRLAIGSTRARVVRLMLAESLTLGLAGGVLGLTLALWTTNAIVASFGADAPYWIRFGIDWRVFAFCAAVTVGTAALFGIAPALHASRQEPQAALKDGGSVTTGRRGRRVAGGLVMAQLALALLLLAGAGLLIKTVARSLRFDPGFDASRVLQGDVSLPAQRYATPGSIAAFASAVMEGLGRIPGTRAGIQGFVFFRGFGAQGRTLTVEGMTAVPAGASPSFYFVVTPGYFRVLGAPIRQGREFAPGDATDVVVVNETMAARLWGSETPLGRRVKFGDKPWRTVIGVVGNINGGSIAARPNSLAYVPLSSEPVPDLTVTIAADREVAGLARDVRAAVHAVDRDQPVEDLMTMAAMFREQAAPARFVALLMSGLAFVALALASVGLYGVTAHGVRRRLREIGIRLALGGTASDMVRLVLRSAWTVIAPGLVLGTAAAYAGTRTLQGILFGTSPTDPIVFAATVAVLAGVATLASYLPARRASRVDPIVVLRAL